MSTYNTASLLQSATSNCFNEMDNLTLDDTTIKHLETQQNIANDTIECVDEKLQLMAASSEDLLSIFQEMADDLILAERGYRLVEEISDTIQEYVAIKKINKNLFTQQIAIEDGMSVIVDENIVKEAVIQHYLTVANTPIGGYVTKFYDFFEDESFYYLVMEYVSDITLKDFVSKAHQYIRSKQLKLKQWKKITKYIIWQLSVTLYWMHHDLNCCHLDLSMENIMIENGDFIANDDGTVSIDNQVSIKLSDFGRSEIFPKQSDFICNKYSIIGDTFHLQSPQVNAENDYNALSADVWSLGVIIYSMAIGNSPYRFVDESLDSGYKALVDGNIIQHLRANNLIKYFDTNLLILLSGCLGFEENERISIEQVIQSQWLSCYYVTYAQRIEKKSAKQLLRKKISTVPQ